MKQLDYSAFQSLSKVPIVDVRAPLEYEKGHIPGAVNVPLFDDNERATVGTTYKHEGRYSAIKEGLSIAGPKLRDIIEEVENLNSEKLRMYCWRGGMRSSSVGWLLETAGFEVQLLNGGYKTYRNKIISFYERKLPIVLIGGETGAGKTDVLKALADKGEQVIDLEAIASHRGSAFGGIGQKEQPFSEHFQNLVFEQFEKFNLDKVIWLEDESAFIGKVGLTESLWATMRKSPIVYLKTPLEKRVERLVADYGKCEKQLLSDAILKIKRKIGGQNVIRSIEFLEKDDFHSVARILLSYYDKSYRFLLDRKKSNIIQTIEVKDSAPELVADRLIRDNEKLIAVSVNAEN